MLQPGNAIFTLLASQLIGYGFAGMFRKHWTRYPLRSEGTQSSLRRVPGVSYYDALPANAHLCQLV